MLLFIEGLEHTFTPIKTFRQAYQLQATFGVNQFEPKDYIGLGSIERAGAELIGLREVVLCAAARPQTLIEWMNEVTGLVDLFRQQLEQVNDVVGLHQVEIEFAAGGFADVLHAVIYELFRVRAIHKTLDNAPPFATIYSAWINSTVKISQTVHQYPYSDHNIWEIRVVMTAYGRCGLIVQAVDGTHYVYDGALGCPAEGYMLTLLSEVAALIYRCA